MTARRHGFVLPLVMVCMLVVMVVVGNMQFAAWRGVRGARLQFEAQHAQYEANAAVTSAVAHWDAVAAAQHPIGQTTWSSAITGGWRTETAIARTAPMVAVVSAHTYSADDPRRVRRGVTRIVHLLAPLRAESAVRTFGALRNDGANIDGQDRTAVVDPQGDDCGPLRDTASVPDVQHVSAPSDVLTFDQAWPILWRSAVDAAPAPDGSLRAPSDWVPLRVAGDSSGVTFDGLTQIRGLLLIDGDLAVRGTLRVEGLLVVRGALDTSAGHVFVDGAVIVRDRGGRGSWLTTQTRVRWAPCLAGRALVAVAHPRASPFHQWNSP